MKEKNQNGSQKAPPKVSVVVSTFFPGYETLRDVLESVVHLEYPSDLVDRVVVGAPQDDVTRSLVEEINSRSFNNFRLFLVDCKTASATRNFGIRQCSTEIIAVIDDDIVMDRQVITNSLKI